MVTEEIAGLVSSAVKKAQKRGELPVFDVPPIVVESPKHPEYGDYAVSVAMASARFARMAPMKIAEAIVKNMKKAEFIGEVSIAHPGFINFRLNDVWVAEQVDAIRGKGLEWGNVDRGKGRSVQVEYVSANPTGPLHFGGARNAVLGDTVANLLEAGGYKVQREYYVNDAGTQMKLFGETLFARYAQALGVEMPVPEEGYRGEYMVEWGREIASEHGRKFLEMPKEEALKAITELGLRKALDTMESDLKLLGVVFDRWFSEKSLYENGTFDKVMTILRENDLLGFRDGAVWFLATKLGGQKDEVLIRSDGTPGYFASDIAYHYDKFVIRKFDRVVDVWAVDHQGHVPRMKLVMKALGLDPERLTILLYGLVRLKRGGQEVKISKRSGDIIPLREVVEEVGSDAVRFMLLTRSAESTIDFDLELAVKQSSENPVYYVQYAHARIASILRKAREMGIGEEEIETGDVHLLTHPAELAVIRHMLKLEEIIDLCVSNLAPHHLPFYAMDLASLFHALYRDCRVLPGSSEDMPVSLARLKLMQAIEVVLEKVLGLMGVSAPEEM